LQLDAETISNVKALAYQGNATVATLLGKRVKCCVLRFFGTHGRSHENVFVACKDGAQKCKADYRQLGHARFYRPETIVVSSTSQISFSKLIKSAQKIYSAFFRMTGEFRDGCI